MPIRVGCPSCRTSLKLADDLAGKAIKCPKCASVLRVPRPGPPAGDEVDELEEVEAGAPRRGPREKEAGPGLSIEHDVPRRLRGRVAEELSGRERLVWVGRPNARVLLLRAIPVFVVLLFFLTLFGGGLLFAVGQAYFHGIGKFDFKHTVLEGGSVLALTLAFFGMILWQFWRVYLQTRASYALTGRRAIVWSVGWNGRVAAKSYPPARLARTRRVDSWFGDGAGDLIFHTKTVVTVTRGKYGGTSTDVTHYGFLAIDDVAGVERLLRRTLIEPYADRPED